MTEPPLLRRWDEVDALFRTALELPEPQRADFVTRTAGGNIELRDLVLSLLASARPDSETGFAGPLARDLIADVAAELDDSAEQEAVGQRVGRYRLLRRIGRGGAGSVFEAERDDGAFTQRVAIKLLRRGLDTDDILARFRAERQILASMSHPHIARLLDGGATDDGRPFLVMELVHGQTLDAWCRSTGPTLERRLELFMQVASAVEHAHRSLVVHRDLKPSNILVTADGTAKLLDFGIARLLDDAGTGVTRTGVRPMTPAYASPEQRSGDLITTASDIYQLGLVLYELCSGVRPGAVTPDALPHGAPDRSPAVDTAGTGRIVPPSAVADATVRRRLRGDLDTIVMKALREGPARRYGTVQQFADDIRRYLDGYPILARPDSWSYRAHRFIARNRAASVAGLAALLALMAWGSTAAVQASRLAFERNSARAAAAEAITERDRAQEERGRAQVAQTMAERERNRAQSEFERAELQAALAFTARERAESERDRAAMESAKSRRVTEFLVGLFEAADPGNARGVNVTARELLDQGVAQAEQLADEPEVQAELLAVMARVHRALGAYDRALPLAQRVLQMRRALNGAGSEVAVANALNEVAIVLRQQGDLAGAEAVHREALALRRRHLGPVHNDIAESLSNLGLVLRIRGQLAEAEAAQREALAMRTQLLGAEHPGVARILNNLAVVLRQRGDLAGAEAAHRQALAIRRRALGNSHPDVAQSLNNLGLVVRARGDLAEAELLHREALEIHRVVFDESHPERAASLSNLGLVLRDRGDLTGAEAVAQETVDILQRQHSAHPDLALALANLGVLQRQRGNLDGAEAAQREALAMRVALFGEEHTAVASSLNNLAQVLRSRGEHGEAESLMRRALAIQQSLLGNQHADVALTLNNIGLAARDRGDHASAEDALRASLAMRRSLLSADHPDLLTGLYNLATVLRETGKLAEAEVAVREAVEGATRTFGPTHTRTTLMAELLDAVVKQRAQVGAGGR